MKKAIAIFTLAIMLLSLSAMAASNKFCTESDGGKNAWTGGSAADEKGGTNVDDCDGESSNLKELYCEDDKIKVDNINCKDFDAVCVTTDGADYCQCPKGTTFNERTQMCTEEDVSVPEFGILGATFAIAGAGLVLVLMRRK